MQSLNLLKPAAKPPAPTLLRRIWPDELTGKPALAETLPGQLSALEEAQRIIAQQEEQIRALENMALTDELTGLLNRRGFGLALQRELSLARRNPAQVGVLVMADLDGFKAINDLWGHAAGDDYLQAVAETLAGSVRASDLVGRLGGDEFVLLFTGMDEETGMKRLARLEKAFNARQIILGTRKVSLRASFGLTAYNGNDTPDALLAAADIKLYAHKARKRGTLVG